jgi:DNA repair protein RecO (recombination protein O)
MGASYKAEAVVLRSLRLGEADRVLHLYTRERGRVGAVAKGIRKTRSRFGARLEPLTEVSLVLHEGRGELHTVSAADIVESHHAAREDPYRLAVGLAGLEAVSRLFAEGEPSPRAHLALQRFLGSLDEARPQAPDPARDPRLLSLQLKLHWVAGFAPELERCAACGSDEGPLERFSAAAGGTVCASCPGGFTFSPGALNATRALLARPIAEAPELPPAVGASVARAVADMHAEHGGFRLRTLAR